MEERVSHTPDASPFRLFVRDLVRRPGSHREFDRDFALPERLGTEVMGVPKGADVALRVQCEVVTDGIWVDGTIAARATGECSRCLDEVGLDIEAPVQGLFLYPDAPREDGDDADDVFEVDGDSIDLEEVVRDAVVTDLPFIPLCSPDCPGLCDQCGARLADDPDHGHEIVDPRWSALESVKDNIALSDKEES